MNWKRGFKRIAWVISGFVWIAVAVAYLAGGIGAEEAAICAALGITPWLVYAIGLFVIRGFSDTREVFPPPEYWKTIRWLALSTEGRATVPMMWVEFAFYIGCMMVGAFFMGLLESHSETVALAAFLTALIPAIWVKVAVGIKRCHDLGYSGAILVLALVPLVNLFFLVLYFVPGSAEANEYGNRPQGFSVPIFSSVQNPVGESKAVSEII